MQQDTRLFARARRPITVGLVVCVMALAVSVRSSAAQSAATLYQKAMDREKVLRANSTPPLASLRSLATTYENIVRKAPTSGYSDNALWQASGVLQLALERGGTAADRERAVRLLRQLSREYPKSSLVRNVDARIRTLSASASRTAEARTAPPAPASASVPARLPPPVLPPISSQAAPSAPVLGGVVSLLETAPPPPRVQAQTKAPESIAPAAAEIRAVTHTKLPKGDRLVLEFTAEAAFVSSRTTEPDQLFFSFSSASIGPRTVISAATIRGPLMRSVRIGSRTPGSVQMSIELAGAPRFSAFPLYDPYRLVVDIETDGALPDVLPAPAPTPGLMPPPPAAPPAGRPAATVIPSKALPVMTALAVSAAAVRVATPQVAHAPAAKDTAVPASLTKPAAAASTSDGGYSLSRQLGLGISRIVIDPGHGGHDPGAQAHGVSESELVLDVALRAEKLLSDQPGFDVVLTRRGDEFIPLEERTAMANREGADLFLSIHANASPQNDTRGVETYFLNFSRSPQAEAVAARENASNLKTMGTMPALVKAITLNNKLEESQELATMVQASLVRRLKAQNQLVKDLGVKQAPFVVLIGAQMPSVLAEISFLTNKAEAGLLKQSAYRQRIAQALADAVLKYQASLKKVSTVASTR